MSARAVAPLAVAVLVATACGAKQPTSAAGVAPRDTLALVSLRGAAVPGETRRALALLPGGPKAQRLADRVAWARVARTVDVAILGPRQAVAYVLPRDRKAFEKRLDARGLAHARIRGWTAFAPQAGVLEAAKRGKGRLLDAPWYRRAHASAPSGRLAVIAHRGAAWTVVTADGATARRTTPGKGRDQPHPLARWIPSDAIVAAASHDSAQTLRSLPFGAAIERGLGLPIEVLATATPGSAVLFVRPGEPFAPITLVSQGGTLGAAARVVRALDPLAPPPVPAEHGGLAFNDVALGPIDLSYGRRDGNLVLTDDPGFTADPPHAIEPPGLPSATSAWLYLDAARAPQALATLAFLADTTVSSGFRRRLAGLRSVLAYITHSGRATTVIVSVDNRQ